MESFKDKVVVITGGATGIGFGFAKALGSEGAKIVIAEPREHRLQEAVAELQALGIEAVYQICDVTVLSEVEALVDFAWAWQGHVDVLFNNAGIMNENQPFLSMPMEDVRKVFEVNFFAVAQVGKLFASRFVEQGTPAAIYNLGSENALFHGVPLGFGYVASKHAVFALSHSMAEELPDHIEVRMICPGFVGSELVGEEVKALAMSVDDFIAIALPQLKEGSDFLVVTHSYNLERVKERYAMIERSFEKHAPRHEGDQQYDIRTLVDPIYREQGISLRPVS